MKLLPALLLLLISCLFSACSSRYDQMASELCKCMQPLAALNEQIKQIAENGDTARIRALLQEVDKTAEESDECAQALEVKYGTLSAEDEHKTREALRRNCPDVAKIIEETEKF